MPAAEDLQPHHPRAEVMEAVLARLDAEHGGAAGWLVERGLDEAALDRLRARLRTPRRCSRVTFLPLNVSRVTFLQLAARDATAAPRS